VEIEGLYHDPILMEIESDRRGEFERSWAGGELYEVGGQNVAGRSRAVWILRPMCC
jgi:hypothetical protein